MLRQLLLSLAASQWLKRFVLGFPLARRVSRRFVAGETLSDALSVVHQLEAEGLAVALDLLGENVHTPDAAERAVEEYSRILTAVRQLKHADYISLKLTQLGLDLGEELCLENLEAVLVEADRAGTFVRIDMEGSEYTERTLRIFEQARSRHQNVGIVLQAYLHRTRADVDRVNAVQGRVRLCKGAYAEPPTLAYQSRERVSQSFVELMQELLVHGHYPAIATHDEEMIAATLRFVQENKIPADRFEFQMLYGIRRERQIELRRQGYNVRIYLPFGNEWYPYFMRRLAERPANLVFFLTALFRG